MQQGLLEIRRGGDELDARLDKEEERLRRERRQALIERLNANDEYLYKLEGRRHETARLSEEELAQEIERERERNLSRRGFSQAGG